MVYELYFSEGLNSLLIEGFLEVKYVWGHVLIVGAGVQRFIDSQCGGQRVWDLEEILVLTYL